MIPASITVSHHAWMRFITRWWIYKGKLPPCPMVEFRRLLAQAKRVDLGPGAVYRALDNNMETASYYECDIWRFVMDEDSTRLITVERIWFPSKKRKSRKRR
jgi:hypothetical protein